jgi:hypothetical protein
MKLPFPRASLWGLALSQAPLLWEAATRVLGLIRGRLALARDPVGTALKSPGEMTFAEIAVEVDRLRRRLQALDESQVEQVKLIQQVVEQHRALALAMHVMTIRYRVIVGVAAFFLAVDAWMGWWIWKHK